MPTRPAHAITARPRRRRLGIVIAVLLLTLLAHLMVIEWLKNELQLIAPSDDDDEPMISITLQADKPAPPAPATPPAPPPAVTKKAVAAVPKAQQEADAGDAAKPAAPEAGATVADATTTVATQEGSATAAASPPAADSGAAVPADALFERASPPPPAELRFDAAGIRADGSRLEGHGTMEWRHDGQRYTLTSEIKVLVFTLAKYRSEGDIGKLGIAPQLYAEKRFGRSETNTHFQKQAQLISFSASTATAPAVGGEQDRGTWVWQLASLGRGDPDKFEPGLALDMTVAGSKAVDVWHIYVNGRETITLPDGEVSAWRLSVVPGADSFDKQIDLWLSPDREWYPVKLQHQDKNGSRVELVLTKITAR